MKLFLLGLMAGVYSVPVGFRLMRWQQSNRDEARIRHEDLVTHISHLSIAMRDTQRPFEFRGAL